MAISFPTSPSDGATYTYNGITYVFNAADTRWTGQFTAANFSELGTNSIADDAITPAKLNISGTAGTTGQILSLAADGSLVWADDMAGGGAGGLAFSRLHIGAGDLTLDNASTVLVILVGGGAGGEHTRTAQNAGGGGRKVIGYYNAPAGTYTLVQGGAGAGDGGFNAGAGGESSGFGFTAPGGTQNNGNGGEGTSPTDGIVLFSGANTQVRPPQAAGNTPSGELNSTMQSIIASAGLGVTVAIDENASVADLNALYQNIHFAGTGGLNTDSGLPRSGRAGYVAVFY